MTEKEPSCTECQCQKHLSDPAKRRSMLAMLVGASSLLLLPRLAWAKKIALKLDKVSQLKKVGGWTIVKVKDKEILLIRDTEKTARALSPFCSHQKHRLDYDAKARQIHCPNHGSQFGLTGKVLKGPAKSPLNPVYWAKLDLANQRIILKIG